MTGSNSHKPSQEIIAQQRLRYFCCLDLDPEILSTSGSAFQTVLLRCIWIRRLDSTQLFFSLLCPPLSSHVLTPTTRQSFTPSCLSLPCCQKKGKQKPHSSPSFFLIRSDFEGLVLTRVYEVKTTQLFLFFCPVWKPGVALGLWWKGD